MSEKKCKKCGCDIFIREGDWLRCANCGATFFDLDSHEEMKQTMQVEQLEQKKKHVKKKRNSFKDVVDFCVPIVIAVVIAMLLKMFVFANAVVPTGSMLNTIQLNDRVIASKLTYDFSDPQRYDVVIFYYPDDENTIYVKRIVGLPGETLWVQDGTVYVQTTSGDTIQLDDSFVTVEEPTGDYGPYEIPEDHYFMMGDNRNDSKDSRFWENKYVARDKIIGKVLFRYYPSFSKIE